MAYAYPEMLVDTAWAEAHLADSKVRFVEVDVDTLAYEEGHLPGAVGWDWTRDLCDTVTRDILSKQGVEALLGRAGVARDTTVVLYGDNNNWFAAWALWQLKIYGHPDVRLMDGGRNKWLAEGRPLTDQAPSYAATTYEASEPDRYLRGLLADVTEAVRNRSIALVDVRSAAEFTGEILAPPGLPETCQRGGHVPGAVSVPWGQVCNADGTFRSFEELSELYASKGITRDRPVVAYCRIGERSSHTWFVLKYLLGFPDVRNYDGSWTEWGNLVGQPIEK